MRASKKGGEMKALPLIRDWETEEFKNVHGERYVIHSNGYLVLLSGDEVSFNDGKSKSEDGVINLFNEDHCIWNPSELILLGRALETIGMRLKEKAARVRFDLGPSEETKQGEDHQ
jgi:hypothetical protein